MRARDAGDAIGAAKRGGDVAPEHVPRAARGQPPPGHVLGVGPEQVAHGPLVRHLLLAVQGAHGVQGGHGGGEAAVDSQDAAVDEGGERQIVKCVRAVPPNVRGAVLADALVVEAVDLNMTRARK